MTVTTQLLIDSIEGRIRNNKLQQITIKIIFLNNHILCKSVSEGVGRGLSLGWAWPLPKYEGALGPCQPSVYASEGQGKE